MAHDPSGNLPVTRQARVLQQVLEEAQGSDGLSGSTFAELVDRLEDLCRSVEGLERDYLAEQARDHQAAKDRARLAAIVESSEDAIISQTLEGTITSWNHSAERFYGYSADEMVGHSIFTIVPPDHHEEVQRTHEKLRHGQRIPPFETVRRRRDGELIDISLTISPIRDRSGWIVGAAAIQRDITLRKQNETALARAHMALQRKNKEMREFFSIIAHDLKHPVMGVDWMLGLLDRDARRHLQPHEQRNLDMAVRECGRIQQMLEQLGQLVRIARTEPEPERVDLGEMLHGCAERFREPARQSGVELHVDAPSVQLTLARSFIEQMVLNLLDNAIKYGCGEGAGRIELTAHCESAECRISVADHGPGIPEHHREEVFRPFRRLNGDSHQNGSGLGLPAVRRLAQSLDGRVELESEPGRGACFTIRLPLTEHHPAPA